MNNPKYIILHCSDVSYTVVPDQLKSINQYHRDERGFPKSSLNFFVGYHYLITGEREYQCRADADDGAHCNQHENGLSLNFQSIGICVGFDGDIEYPTATQYALLQKRVWALQDKYSIPNENVRFHRQYATSKTCPGSLITDKWLVTLLKRPVVTNIPEKPMEVRCVAEEAQIKSLKEQLSWFDKAYSELVAWVMSYVKSPRK